MNRKQKIELLKKRLKQKPPVELPAPLVVRTNSKTPELFSDKEGNTYTNKQMKETGRPVIIIQHNIIDRKQ
ncbi:MAG: hypothetical protein JNL47_02940 [Bacteroidia bacterium]|nr:hypothetical protein [Bacteroidia bacterium]